MNLEDLSEYYINDDRVVVIENLDDIDFIKTNLLTLEEIDLRTRIEY